MVCGALGAEFDLRKNICCLIEIKEIIKVKVEAPLSRGKLLLGVVASKHLDKEIA